jgi:hypothetical protein
MVGSLPGKGPSLMAVMVYLSATSNLREYEKGQAVRLEEDGHLVVTGTDRGDVLAMYAPGNWHHAEVK